MKMGAEDKKKLGILVVVGVLALGAIVYMYMQLSTPDVARPAATTVTVPVLDREPPVTLPDGPAPMLAADARQGVHGADGEGRGGQARMTVAVLLAAVEPPVVGAVAALARPIEAMVMAEIRAAARTRVMGAVSFVSSGRATSASA